jgi:hypothetical protein
VAQDPRLIIEVPAGSPVERQLRSEAPASVAAGEAVIAAGPTDALGNLEAESAGEVVLSVPSPEALREPDQVRSVIARAGTGVEPLVIVVEVAEELRDDELSAAVAAADHTERPVILRVVRGAA